MGIQGKGQFRVNYGAEIPRKFVYREEHKFPVVFPYNSPCISPALAFPASAAGFPELRYRANCA